MSKLFYPKLAAQNCVKNGKFYFPYLLTVTGCSAAFYIILALAQTSSLPEMQRYYYLNMFMVIGAFLLGFFTLIFLFYTNSFLMKRREKEISLYNILGMGKRNIAVVLSFEALYTWVMGVGSGILFGMLLQRIVTMLLTKLLRMDVMFSFYISWTAIWMTALFFGAVLLLTLMNNLRRLHVQKPVELLRGGNMGEREPKTKWLLTVLGVITLGAGYYMAVSTANSMKALEVYFIAVFLVIIGTYCLFSAVSVAILKALRKNKKFFYRTGNFIGVSGMLHRMNRNAVGLANICILSTMVLVMVSSTLALFLGTEDMLSNRYPGDINIDMQYYTSEPFNINKVETKLEAAVEKQGLKVERMTGYSVFETTLDYSGGDFIMHVADTYGTNSGRYVVFLVAEDYNKLSGQNVSLEKGQILFSGADVLKSNIDFRFREYNSDEERVFSFSAAPTPENFHTGEFDVYASVVDYIILPDLDTMKEMKTAHSWAYGSDSRPRLSWKCIIDTDGTDEQIMDCAMKISDADVSGLTGDDEINWEQYVIQTREENREEFYSMNGGFFFLGIFLGVIFLMATVLIIYYKQISEGYEDRERFRIMRQVGLEKREIRRSINLQILIVFFAPLVVAGIHVAFDFNLMSQLLKLFGLVNPGLSIWCTLGTFLVFALIYALVYMLTARVYYRIVSDDSKN